MGGDQRKVTAVPTEEVLNYLDTAAMYRHGRRASATAHGILAEKVWGALRDLGVERGRMLVTGPYAASLTGTPDADRVADMRYRQLVAPIPPVAWPHDRLRPEVFTEYHPARHDVVIANLPFADLHLRSQHDATRVRQLNQELLADAIESTFPGGVVVAIATRHILDHPVDTERQFLFADRVRLLGAVRLPGTTLHPRLGRDEASPLDLIVLRRSLDREAPGTSEGLDLARVHLPGGVGQINELYAHRPDDMLGQPRMVADPDRDTTLFTLDEGATPWDRALENSLSRITSAARSNGLTAVSASWAPPTSRLAPQADWSAGAGSRISAPSRRNGIPPRHDTAVDM